jgi:hypothetical protein
VEGKRLLEVVVVVEISHVRERKEGKERKIFMTFFVNFGKNDWCVEN